MQLSMNNKTRIFSTLAIAIFASLIFGQLFPKNPQKYAGNRFYLLKAMAKPVYDVVIMGDSRAREDLSPNVIEDSVPGIKVLNFAFSNGGLNPVIFQAAEKKLNPVSKHPCMVLSVTALTLHPISLPNKQYLDEVSRPREDKIERLYLAGLFSYFSPVTPLSLIDSYKHVEPKTIHFSTFYDNGWSPSDMIPPDTSDAIQYYIDDYKWATVSYEQLKMVSQQVKEWTNKGIKVICLRPPTTVQMKELEDTMGKYDETRIRNELTEAGALWVPFKSGDYFCFDGSHLNKEAAIKVSSQLAKVIKQQMSE